jgi:hypothetical protein
VKSSTLSTSKIVLNTCLLVVALIAVFWPLEAPGFDYKWKPAPQSTQTRIPLIEQTPDFFKITFECQAGIKTPDWVVNSEGGTPFQVALTDEFVVVTTKNFKTQELNNIYLKRNPNKENCISSLTFSQNVWTLNDFGQSVSKKNPSDTLFEISNILEWNPGFLSENSSIQIKSSPFVLEHSSFLRTATLLILGLLVLIQYLAKMSISKITASTKSLLKKNYLAAALWITLLVFVSIPKTDDGGYLISARALRDFGVFSIYYVPVSAPTGHLHTVINSIFSFQSASIVLGRLIPALFLFGSFVVIDKIIKKYQSTHNLLFFKYFSYFTWILASTSLMTLRPEPIIGFFLTLNLYLIYSQNENNYAQNFLISILIGVFAISIHQTGIIVLATAFSFLFSKKILVILKGSYLKIIHLITICLVITFYWQTPQHALKAYQQFSTSFLKIFPGQFDVIYPPWFEFKRIEHLLNSGLSTGVVKLLALLTLFYVLLIVVIRITHKFSTVDSQLLIASLLVLMGLSLVPTKWSLYYPALFPVLIFLQSVFLKYRNKYHEILLLVGLVVIGFIALNTNWRAQDSDWPLVTVDLTQSSIIDILRENTLLLFLLVFLFGVIFYLRIKNISTLIYYSYASIATILIFFQITPPIVDATKSPTWSFVHSNFASTTNAFNNCGMAEYLDDKSNPNFPIKELIKDNAISPEMIYFNPCEKLIDLRMGVWQEPKYGVGPVTGLDQQRLAFGTQIDKIACLQEGDDPKFERYCYYKWESSVQYLISY